MSVEAISWAFRVPGIDDTYEAFVLVALANYADDYGVSFPAASTLAEQCRCSLRKVRYALAALEARGLILSVARRRPNGSQRSSAYILIGFPERKHPSRPDEHPVLEQLHIEGQLDWDAIRVHAVHPVSGEAQGAQGARGGCTGCTGGVHGVHGGGAQRAPLEPSLEPSLEPKQEPPPKPPADLPRRTRKERAHGEEPEGAGGNRRRSYSDVWSRGWARALAQLDPPAADGSGSDHG